MDGYLNEHDTLDSRQFVIAVRKLADSLSYGTDRSPFLGAGVEYVQSRTYQFGDPIRSIDWRVTARTGRVHIKEYEAPKRLPCYLLLDTSASMAIGSTQRTKYGLALHIAGGLAFASLDRVSPVGLVGLGDRELRVSPSLSKHQVMQWLHRLRHFRYDEPTALSQRIAELGPSLTERALVIVLSDLHAPKSMAALKRLAQLHDCAVIQLQDPAEQHLKGSGLFRAREAETGRAFVTHGRSEWTDPEAVASEFKRCGIDHLVVRTDRPFAQSLRHFFRSRDLLGRGAR